MVNHHVDHFFKTLKREQAVLPEEFNTTLHQKLVAVNIAQPKPKKYTLLLKIIPALLIICALFGGYHLLSQKTVEQHTAAQVVRFDPVTIELTYIAEKPLKDVSFAINLQHGVSFFSTHSEINNLRSHSWQGDLKKGTNKIPIVVSVNQPGHFTIDAIASFAGYRHKHQITLKTGKKSVTVTYLELPKEQLDETP